MSLPELAQRHRSAVYLATLLLCLGGIWGLLTLPAGIYPEVAFPRIVVLVRGGTLDATSMNAAVTRPLEEAMSGVIDLRRIRSRSIRGGAEISLYFGPGADMQFALQQVQGRVAALQPELPPGTQVSTDRLTPSAFPIVQYELTGADPMALRDFAQYFIRPSLAGLPSVGAVEVQGGDVREVSVILDVQRMISQRISAGQVADAIRASNVLVSAGRVDQQYRQFGIVVSGLARTPQAIADVVVVQTGERAVRVGDLGTVHFGPADRFFITTGNGRPAVLINVSRQPNGNTLEVQQGVRTAVDALRSRLPTGAQLSPVYDQGALVRASLASVRDAIIVGGLLAIAVLLLFLGRFRITMAAGLAVPLALIMTFLGLRLAAQSLNLMSLGGLAVAIGLVIDDAVVVVENIERQLRAHAASLGGGGGGREGDHALHRHSPSDGGREVAQVLSRAVEAIIPPVVGSTVTTVVVFLPLGLLEGVVGDFFRAFAISLALAVTVSLFLALTLIPALLGPWLARERLGGAGGAGGASRRWMSRLEESYARLTAAVLNKRRWGLALAVGLVLAAVALVRVVGSGFLPAMDEGGFILDYATPTGTSLAETDRQLRVIEGILATDPAVLSFSRRTGAELGLFATAQNSGDFAVLLKSRAQRHASVYAVMDRVRVAAAQQAPIVRVEFVQILQDIIDDLAGAPAPVEVKLFGPERASRETAARAVAAAIEDVPGLVDLFDGVQGELPQLAVAPDASRVARLGLTVDEVGAQARDALFGVDAGSLQEPDRLVPVRVRLDDSLRYNPQVCALLPIIGPNGWAPLQALGAPSQSAEPAELVRENLRDMVVVTAGVEAADLGSVMRQVRQRLRHVPLPADVTLELGGQEASRHASFHQLLLVFGLAVGAVLLVLVAQFGDVKTPMLIMGAALLGLTGAFAALAITRVPFNVSSFMGLILLVGLVVKNGIILLDTAARRRREGMDTHAALLAAGRNRLRPILMTTLCTIAGLAPLALGLGAGAELQRPLAIAVIGGLTLSTLVTLVLLPVGVATLERRAPARGADS